MSPALRLATAMRDPASVAGLDAAGWNALIAVARAEQMIGSLAHRLAGLDPPAAAERVLADALASAGQGRVAALWEAEMARRVLTPLGVPVVLLKGTAYVAAGLKAGVGRSIGDLDILVPRDALDAVEAALLAAGWEWVKADPYDDDYYRRWMHELPPLIHRERDRMIDVHHTILPLTARITPDAGAMLADSEPLENGLSVLSREDMVLHSIAHLLADGDLAGGLRNFWDVHCLLEEFEGLGFGERLAERARLHGLERELSRALRLREALYLSPQPLPLPQAGGGRGVGPRYRRRATLEESGSPPPNTRPRAGGGMDAFYLHRLLARDAWGRPTRKLTRLAFFIRSHWLRMPPLMLARHLWTKWRKGHSPA